MSTSTEAKMKIIKKFSILLRGFVWRVHIWRDCTKVGEDIANNKASSTRKSDTGSNTFAVQDTNNPIVDDMRKELVQMRSGLGLVLKYVSGGA